MPTRSTLSNADQLHADIIAAVPLVGKRPPVCCAASLQVRFLRDDARPFRTASPRRAGRRSKAAAHRRQAPGARSISTFTNRSLPSERLSRWRVSAFGGLAGGEQAQAHLLVGHGVIAGEQRGVAAADQ